MLLASGHSPSFFFHHFDFNFFSRSLLVPSRRSQVQKSQVPLGQSLSLNFLKKLGVTWLTTLSFQKSRIQFIKVLRIWINGITKWMIRMPILSASVCIHPTSWSSSNFQIKWYPPHYFTVLDPNVKNAYALDKWDAESYTAGMTRLEKVVRCLSTVDDRDLEELISCILVWYLLYCTCPRNHGSRRFSSQCNKWTIWVFLDACFCPLSSRSRAGQLRPERWVKEVFRKPSRRSQQRGGMVGSRYYIFNS